MKIPWPKRPREDQLPPLPIRGLLPLPPPTEETEYMSTPVPVEYTKPSHDLTEVRDIYARGAQAFDQVTRELNEYRHKLDQAMLGLEAKNTEIMSLQVELAAERSRVVSYQGERDEAVNERAQAEARLLDIKAIIERAELPPPKHRRRGRRADVADATSNGGDLLDQTGSQAPVAEAAPVVAHE